VSFVGASNWTAGFVPGSFWLLYEYTGQPIWRARADLLPRSRNTNRHREGRTLALAR
jgi:hypothetical protein